METASELVVRSKRNDICDLMESLKDNPELRERCFLNPEGGLALFLWVSRCTCPYCKEGFAHFESILFLKEMEKLPPYAREVRIYITEEAARQQAPKA